MKHSYYGVYNKHMTLVLSHRKFAVDKPLALQAQDPLTLDSGRIFVVYT